MRVGIIGSHMLSCWEWLLEGKAFCVEAEGGQAVGQFFL